MIDSLLIPELIAVIFQISWGQGKGMQDFAKFWNVEYGCAYIPWGMFQEVQLRRLQEGCIIDEVTLPPGMNMPKGKHSQYLLLCSFSILS